jgi:FkbM family methyltransferase
MARAPRLTLDPLDVYRLSNGLVLAAPPPVPFRAMFAEVFGAACYQAVDAGRLRAGATVLDVGANVGLFAVWVALRAPAARVFAFEAARDNYRALAQNVRDARLGGISAHHYAVTGRRSARVTLYRGVHGGVHSIRPEYRNWDPARGGPRPTERVRTITLERILRRFALERVDVLKLDCEGAEHEILRAAPSPVLARIRRIVGEYHDLGPARTGDALCALLTRRGFTTRRTAAGPGIPWGMFVAARR